MIYMKFGLKMQNQKKNKSKAEKRKNGAKTSQGRGLVETKPHSAAAKKQQSRGHV